MSTIEDSSILQYVTTPIPEFRPPFVKVNATTSVLILEEVPAARKMLNNMA